MVFVVQATTPRAPGVCPALPCPVDTRGTSSHTQQRRLACPARPVVPPLLQGLVVHIDYFVPNLIANAETSVQNVLWRVLLFQLWCNFTLSVTTSYSTVG